VGAKREYTAIFSIGAKLLGSFKGAMAQAQSRMKSLQASTARTTSLVKKLTFGFGGLFALFGSFLAANIFKQIFGGASQEAIEAHQRTRSLLVSLRMMDDIKKKGKGAAEEELKRIYEHNAALEKQGVLHKDILDDMSVILARAKLPSAAIQRTTDKLADVLVATMGPTATAEEGKGMAEAFRKSMVSGNVKALQAQGVDIPKEQAAWFKTIIGRIPRYNALMKILGDNYKNVNEEAANTPEGKLVKFQNAMKTMAGNIGEVLLPAQAELADAWKEALPEVEPLIVAVMKLLLKLVTKLGNVVRTQLIPWWHEFQKSERFQQIKDVLTWCEKHFKGLAITVGILVGLFVGLSVISSILPILILMTSTVGLIVAAVVALAAAVAVVIYNWDTLKEMFPATTAVIEHLIEGFKLSFQTGFDFIKALWATVVALFTGDFTGVGEAWSKVWHDMVDLMGWWKTSLIAIAKEVGKAFKDYFLRVFEDIKSIWTWMKGFSWSGIKKMFSEGKDAATAYGETVSTGQAVSGSAAAAGVAAGGGAAAPKVVLPPEAMAKVTAERAAIVADMMRPENRNLISATLANESDTAEGQKNVLEALTNRAVEQHQSSVAAMIKGGFYGPWNRGETSRVMAKGLTDARSQQVAGMISEMQTRNVLRGMTDQGMVNEIQGYKENIGGEYFGFMGGHAPHIAAYEESKKAAAGGAPPLIARHAAGGIFTRPTLGLFGEAGPEAVVPLSKAGGAGGLGGTAVHFNPVITIHGNASETEQSALDTRLRSLARDFVDKFKRAQTHERRLSYEGGYG
jgi:hypothetical protein